MSWQLASLLVLIAALSASFWWYGRTRPTTREVAVIATLAALAALGRDAFVALPDVKPITAMVLISGLAFGPGPGFAVGAVSALASNVFLGQGPWTPWQMAAWGLVGVGGALLGRLTGRQLGRVSLAVACAAGAVTFSAIINLFTWTATGAHTLAQYVVILAAALPFDLTHVVASFLFALAFGPTLLRMLTRVRTRLEVTWEPAAAVSAAAAALLVVAVTGVTGSGARAIAATSAHPAVAHAASAGGVSGAVGYLSAAQNTDGGFGGSRGQASTELYSAWVAMGLAAAGRHPQDVRRNGNSVLSALRSGAGQLQGTGDLERTILALRACGASVHSLAGHDPVAELGQARSRDGSFAHLVNLTSFAVFSLRAAGRSSSDPTVHAAGRWLVGQENSDGGFSFQMRGAASDVDDTAAAVQALIDAGLRGSAVNRAVTFLEGRQNADGGYALASGAGSNAQSTAWAVQALVASGLDPEAVHHGASRSPLAYLRSLQEPDGSVRYSRTATQTPVWVTAQVLTALARKPFPIDPPKRSRRGGPGGPAGPAPHAQGHHPHRHRVHRRAHAAGASGSAQERLDALAGRSGRAAGMLLGAMIG